MEKTEVIEIIKNSTINRSFIIVVGYWLSNFFKHGEHLEEIAELFRKKKDNSRSESLCYQAIKLIDNHKDYFEVEEKDFFYERLAQIYNDQIASVKYSFNNPFMAISYNIFLGHLIYDKLDELDIMTQKLQNYENLIRDEAKSIQYIKDYFLDINAVSNNAFNLYYFHIVLLIQRNSNNIQSDLNTIYGRGRILSQISKNAVFMIKLLLDRIEITEGRSLAGIAYRLKESLVVLQSLENT